MDENSKFHIFLADYIQLWYILTMSMNSIVHGCNVYAVREIQMHVVPIKCEISLKKVKF